MHPAHTSEAARAGAGASEISAPEPRTVEAATIAPAVTAVVLNWCGEAVTVECLDSLLASDYESLTILLIDNQSPDGSGDRLRRAFPDLPYIQTEENLGYAGGNNRGIAQALADGADYVLILNNDTVVEADAIRKLVDAAEATPRVGAVAPKILFYDRPDRIWFGGGRMSRVRAIGTHEQEGEEDDPTRQESPRPSSFLSGCCLLMPASVLREVGGFQDDFFAYVEDVELSLRLTEAGYTLLYQPEARILHHSSVENAPPSAFQIFLRDRNRRWVARRRFRPLEKLVFSAFFYPTRLLLLAGYAARADWSRAKAVWRGMTID